MLIYGGSNLEAGGFLEPDVYRFERTVTIESKREPLSSNIKSEV